MEEDKAPVDEYTIKYIPDISDIKESLDKLEVFARSILHLINDIRTDIRNGGFDKEQNKPRI